MSLEFFVAFREGEVMLDNVYRGLTGCIASNGGTHVFRLRASQSTTRETHVNNRWRKLLPAGKTAKNASEMCGQADPFILGG